ncbi:hypothetical protein RINTHH_8230 [Richelia intracellularis HH01]|uniref:Uncharacterized protein n=1 Tax=Richelia intracellularis HH01 TaxID=1165094 RepID=M1WZN9_9NOST|nr:hypothetical protein RINTHH_8230 [Richelia intracellularis HH01]
MLLTLLLTIVNFRFFWEMSSTIKTILIHTVDQIFLFPQKAIAY